MALSGSEHVLNDFTERRLLMVIFIMSVISIMLGMGCLYLFSQVVKYLTHFNLQKLGLGEDEPEIVERESCVICHEEFDLKNMVNLHHYWDSDEPNIFLLKFGKTERMLLPDTRRKKLWHFARPARLSEVLIASDCECTAMYCVPCMGTLRLQTDFDEPIQCAVCRK
jgi:hypothetical protein